MADALKLAFAPFATPAKGCSRCVLREGLKFGPATRKALAPTGDLVQRAAAADRFTGKSGSALDIVAPAGLAVAAAGRCRASARPASSRRRISSSSAAPPWARFRRAASEATIFAELAGGRAEARPGGRARARHAAARLCVRPLQDQAQGGRGRAGQGRGHDRASPTGRGAEGLGSARQPVADGVIMARDLDQRAGQRALSGGIRRAAPAR